jgi:hypothetical protein
MKYEYIIYIYYIIIYILYIIHMIYILYTRMCAMTTSFRDHLDLRPLKKTDLWHVCLLSDLFPSFLSRYKFNSNCDCIFFKRVNGCHERVVEGWGVSRKRSLRRLSMSEGLRGHLACQKGSLSIWRILTLVRTNACSRRVRKRPLRHRRIWVSMLSFCQDKFKSKKSDES